MQRSLRIIIFFLATTVAVNKATAQSPDPQYTTPLMELLKLHSVFSDNREIAFDCTYYMENIDTITTIDSMAGFFKFYYDQYWIKLDSVEQVQDQAFNVTAYHDQQVMYLRGTVPFSNYVFHANVLDSAFYSANTDSITVSDSSGYRKLRFHFNSEGLYAQYDITYDTAHYYIRTINFSTRKNLYLSSETTRPNDNQRINVRVMFTNYRVDEDNPALFSTDRFIERVNGKYTPKAPYTIYNLVNSINL